jgi:crossover junction endodeoxyribonuclease RuvC
MTPGLVLGVDPGLERVGWGLVERSGSRLICRGHGLIQTPRIELSDRLRLIHEGISALLKEHEPEALALEKLFFTKNQTTAMDVARASGVILLAAAESGVPVCEYSPPQVKLGVTGRGNAEKKQVQFMAARLLALPEPPKPDDVADGLALAICHALGAQPVRMGSDTKSGARRG